MVEVRGENEHGYAVLYKVYTTVCSIQYAIKLPISHLLKLHPETHRQGFSEYKIIVIVL
jgi:hypothetical protein